MEKSCQVTEIPGSNDIIRNETEAADFLARESESESAPSNMLVGDDRPLATHTLVHPQLYPTGQDPAATASPVGPSAAGDGATPPPGPRARSTLGGSQEDPARVEGEQGQGRADRQAGTRPAQAKRAVCWLAWQGGRMCFFWAMAPVVVVVSCVCVPTRRHSRCEDVCCATRWQSQGEQRVHHHHRRQEIDHR